MRAKTKTTRLRLSGKFETVSSRGDPFLRDGFLFRCDDADPGVLTDHLDLREKRTQQFLQPILRIEIDAGDDAFEFSLLV